MSDEKGFLEQFDPQDLEQRLERIPTYLRITSMGKFIVGFLVVFLVAAVIVLPFLNPEDEGVRIALLQDGDMKTALAEKPVMQNPRFESVDGANQPYTVRAKEAVQQDESLVVLNSINADVTLNSGLWLALSAQQGELDLTGQKLKLVEKVHLIASNGYELRSPNAYVDMKASKASGSKGIAGQGPMGNIEAQEFLIEGDSQRVLFEKDVKLIIYP